MAMSTANQYGLLIFTIILHAMDDYISFQSITIHLNQLAVIQLLSRVFIFPLISVASKTKTSDQSIYSAADDRISTGHLIVMVNG